MLINPAFTASYPCFDDVIPKSVGQTPDLWLSQLVGEFGDIWMQHLKPQKWSQYVAIPMNYVRLCRWRKFLFPVLPSPSQSGLLLLLLQQGDTIRQELRIQFGLGEDFFDRPKTLLLDSGWLPSGYWMATNGWKCLENPLENPMEIRQVQSL